MRRRWHATEIVAVLTRYPAEGPARLAADLGRSEYSVHGLARRFGLRTPRRPYRRRTGTRVTPWPDHDRPNPNADSGTTPGWPGCSGSWNSSAVAGGGPRRR